jgi:hypothetical protein
MSDERFNDGGPAFPVVGVPDACDSPGMSLRDWFAGQALAGFLSQFASEDAYVAMGRLAKQDGVSIKDATAAVAFEHAEAMMAERERRYGKQAEPEAEVEGAAF